MGWTISKVIPSIVSGISLGQLAREMMPVFAYIVLITFILTFEQGQLLRVPFKSMLIPKVLISIITIGLIGAFAVAYLREIGFTFFSIIMVNVIVLIISIFLALTTNKNWGFLLLVMFIPFFELIDAQLRGENFGLKIIVRPSQYSYIYEERYIGIYVACLLLFGLVVLFKRRLIDKQLLPADLLSKMFILFLALVLLSAVITPEPSMSLVGFLDVLSGAIFFILVYYHVNTIRELKQFLWVIMAFTWISTFFTFIYFSAQAADYNVNILYESRLNPVPSWYRSLAGVTIGAVVMVPVALSLFLTRKRGWEALMLMSFIASQALAAIFSQLRSIYLCSLLSLWIMVIRSFGKRKIFLSLIVILIPILVLASLFKVPIITQRFSEWHSINEFSDSQIIRMECIRVAISMMRDHPLFGIGLGRWNVDFPNYTAFRNVWEIVSANSPHNLFLDIGSGSGVPAMIIFIFITVMAVLKFYKLSKLLVGEARILVTGLLSGFIGWVLMNIISGGYLLAHLNMIFFGWIGLSVAIQKIAKKENNLYFK